MESSENFQFGKSEKSQFGKILKISQILQFRAFMKLFNFGNSTYSKFYNLINSKLHKVSTL